jgi:ubiquinone/menaquinone biosynthesis C-methylase UbiE
MGEKKEKVPHICPWYMAYLFDNPLRPLIHDPWKILELYVKPGMTVLDVGCGMGFFSLGMAKMVGPGGKVLSLDLQEKMLQILGKRARRRGLSQRIESRLVEEGVFPIEDPVDFALCFWMVHEVPDQGGFFRELGRILRPGANVLIAEPGMNHVKEEDLEETVRIASAEGFSLIERPKIRMSKAVVLEKLKIDN